MEFSADMRILEFDSFETAFPVQPGQESKAKRRFMTLFTQSDEQAQVGGTSYVCKAYSFTGEAFAVKRLLTAQSIPKDANLTPEDTARITQGHADAFYEEYKNQLLISRMRGFPRLYGYGMIGEDPAIVMEWVEGVSLRELIQTQATTGKAISSSTIAAIGASVLNVLESVTRLDNTLVHRDISPANIMIRTEEANLEEQIERGSYDICLIDFGSASAHAPQDASFTMVSQVWRNGTPEYAPPEMLTQDIPHIDALRKSQAIDVFAFCSVLYELYAGHTPWRVSEHPELSPFRIKTERAPEAIALREESDAELVDAIMSGLDIDQGQRPSVQALLAKMRDFNGNPEDAGASAEELAQRIVAEGHNVLPGLYTPDSTHLKVAAESEGGKRAGEDIEPFVRQSRVITRRTLIAGGIALVAAAVGGGLLARSCQEDALPDYPTATTIYTGSQLYPAMQLDSSTWVLRARASASEVTALGTSNREPGRLIGGLVKAYDEGTGRYGFMTPAQGSSSDGTVAMWHVLPRFLNAGDFSDASGDDVSAGRFAAVQDRRTGLWGYIDTSGAAAIAPAFEDALRFSNGYAAARPQGSTLWGLVDTTGTQALEARFLALGTCSADGLLAAAEQSTDRWGFVDVHGEWAIPESFYRVRRFTEGLAACQRDAGSTWSFVNTNGEVAIEGDFADARPFADGYAPVQDAQTQLWGLIDTSGSWHVEPRYLSLGEKTGELIPAHGSPADVYDIEGSDKRAWREYTSNNSDWVFGYGYIDEDGTWTIKPIYGDTLIRDSEL